MELDILSITTPFKLIGNSHLLIRLSLNKRCSRKASFLYEDLPSYHGWKYIQY